MCVAEWHHDPSWLLQARPLHTEHPRESQSPTFRSKYPCLQERLRTEKRKLQEDRTSAPAQSPHLAALRFLTGGRKEWGAEVEVPVTSTPRHSGGSRWPHLN